MVFPVARGAGHTSGMPTTVEGVRKKPESLSRGKRCIPRRMHSTGGQETARSSASFETLPGL